MLVLLWIFTSSAYVQAQTLAFPGAEGFGRFAKGGRGGRVIEVTNLNDSGPGSFREAVESSGPRTVVFRVGGTIALNGRVNATNPFLTIAGQTAPGEGILIGKGGGLSLRTHDVIVRYIRVRPDVDSSRSDGGDAIQIIAPDSHDVILDHVSMSWAVDEVFSTWGNPNQVSDITVQ